MACHQSSIHGDCKTCSLLPLSVFQCASTSGSPRACGISLYSILWAPASLSRPCPSCTLHLREKQVYGGVHYESQQRSSDAGDTRRLVSCGQVTAWLLSKFTLAAFRNAVCPISRWICPVPEPGPYRCRCMYAVPCSNILLH